MRSIVCIAAAIAAYAAATPASAQVSPDIIVNVALGASRAHHKVKMARRARLEAYCMAGQVPEPADIAGARVAATAALQRYVHLAAREGPVDATAAFTRDTERRHWLRGGVENALNAVDDPLARMLATHAFALPEADAFTLSGDRSVALGIWRVTGDDDAVPTGFYRVRFRRVSESWVVEYLEILDGAAAPGAIPQFCHFPGDADEEATAVFRASEDAARLVREHKTGRRTAAADKSVRLKTISDGK